MSTFIVTLTYKVDICEVEKHLEAHVNYLKAEYAKGSLLVSGRKVPRTGGVILAKASSLKDLDQIIQADPFFKAGVADYDVTEFVPSMTAKGLEALIEPTE